MVKSLGPTPGGLTQSDFFEKPACIGLTKVSATKAAATDMGQALKVRSPWHGSNRQDKDTFVGISVGMH